MRINVFYLAILGVSCAVGLVIVLFNYSLAKASGPYFLRVPFDDINNSHPLFFYFDHNSPNYGQDGEITVYTGESVVEYNPYAYEGHSGYDWPLDQGTPIYAAADGVVDLCSSAPNTYGNYIVIDHQNNYYTLYAHLRSTQPCNVTPGQEVSSGDIIGWSGSTGNSTGPHLHFGVYIGEFILGSESNATDPFGWRGDSDDPLLNFGIGHTAECLWLINQRTTISCTDTVVEDASENFSLGIGTTWPTSPIGNGYHMYYHVTTTGNYWVDWLFPLDHSGVFQVYAWIPSQYATTQRATYYISTGIDWKTSVVSQQTFNDQWAYLGTYRFNSGTAGVTTSANTGEQDGSKIVGIDAIKIRVAPIYLPMVKK